MTIITAHKYNEDHLAEVMTEAASIGSVTINAYYDGETMYCLEGVHRVEAAYRLSIPVIFVARDLDDVITCDAEDIADEDGLASVSDIVAYFYGGPRFYGSVYSEADLVAA